MESPANSSLTEPRNPIDSQEKIESEKDQLRIPIQESESNIHPHDSIKSPDDQKQENSISTSKSEKIQKGQPNNNGEQYSDPNKPSNPSSPIKNHVTLNKEGKPDVEEEEEEEEEKVPQIYYEEESNGGLQLQMKEVSNTKQFDFRSQSENRYREQWNEIYEHEMIAHSSMDRKRQNLEMLRDWDRKRAYFLNVHRSLLETIIQEVDIRMQASGQLMQFFIHYFQNKTKQEMSYARSPIPKVDAALMQNEAARTMYSHLKKGLQLLDEGSFEHAKKVSEFAYTIEKEIIQDILLEDYNDSLNQLSSLHSEIHGFKRILMGLNDRTSRKSGKVAHVYNLSTPKTGYKKLEQTLAKDLYRTQINFLRHAEAQTETQRKLAKATLNFWEIAKDIETVRGKTLSKALTLYSKSYTTCYGEAPQITEASQNIEQGFDQETLEDHFGVQTILTSQDIDFLRNQLLPKDQQEQQLNSEEDSFPKTVQKEKHEEKLTYYQITPFFENFTIEKFDNRMLILKELKAQRSGQAGSFIETHIVITADNFLHCFDQRDQQTLLNSQVLASYFQKPHFSMSLKKAVLRRVSTTNFVVELSVQMPGLLNYLAGSNKYFFSFKNSDEIEEMAQFINSLN